MTRTLGFRTANRRYHLIFWPLMATYVIIILGATLLIDEDAASLPVKVAAAVATTLPLLGTLWVMVRYTRETDEYTRQRHVTAMAQGGAITAGVTFLVGFLQMFGAIAEFEIFWLGTLFFFAYGLSTCAQSLGKTV